MKFFQLMGLFVAVAQASPVKRLYQPGETLSYVMTGVETDEQGTHNYRANFSSRVAQDEAFYEDTQLTNLIYDGASLATPPGHQKFSLDPKFTSLPLSFQATDDSRMKVPWEDYATIYDLLAVAINNLNVQEPGEKRILRKVGPIKFYNGLDCFDMSFAMAEPATLTVNLTPPSEACLKNLSSNWMKAPVTEGSPNNVLIANPDSGSYKVAVGSETIKLVIQIGAESGKILSAEITDHLQVIEKTCADQNGSQCVEPLSNRFERREIYLGVEK